MGGIRGSSSFDIRALDEDSGFHGRVLLKLAVLLSSLSLGSASAGLHTEELLDLFEL